MARKPSAKVVLNRGNLDELHLALVDGVTEIARSVVEEAAKWAPDSPDEPYPIGEGLPKQGGWLVYDGPRKVAGGSLRGIQPKKPQAFVVRGTEGIVGIAGWGFPGRLVETGHVGTPAHPFFTPAAVRVSGVAADIMGEIVGPVLRR